MLAQTRLSGDGRTQFSATVDRGGAPGAKKRERLGEIKDDLPEQEIPASLSESKGKPASADVWKPGEGTSGARCPSVASQGEAVGGDGRE